MESPCTLVCSIDPATGYCLGCGRTGHEIGAWTLYTDAERRAIMAGLAVRLATIAPDTTVDRRRMRQRRERTVR